MGQISQIIGQFCLPNQTLGRKKMSDVVHTINSRNGERRLQVLRRTDGSYSYQEQYHFNNALVGIEGWADLPPHSSLFASLDIALHEARYNFAWVATESDAAQPGTPADVLAAASRRQGRG